MTTMPTPSRTLEKLLAQDLGIALSSVKATVELLDSGATVPFIARYRKEKTGGLSDIQLRKLAERLSYLRQLEERKATILSTLAERGIKDETVITAVHSASTKTKLEAIYAPYKTKRRTKAQIARQAGLEPLVDDLLEVPLAPLTDIAAAYLHDAASPDAPADTAVPDVATALEGARAILTERVLYNVQLCENLRKKLFNEGVIASTRTPQAPEFSKFTDYYAFSEPLRKIPSHRVLALGRGEAENLLKITVDVALSPRATAEPSPREPSLALAREEEYESARHSYEAAIATALGIPVQVLNTVSDDEMVLGWLASSVRTLWRTRLLPRLATEIRTQLFERAERDAITVFSSNLRDLLLSSPAGGRTTLGLDPGIRTGVKCAVIDPTGKVLETAVIYPFAPRYEHEAALDTLRTLVVTHGVELIAIGNGTASRDTDRLTLEAMATLPQGIPAPQKVTVSEAGASVYSASALASQELPGLDVSLRGAVSIARRLQDPLAELVKIDPQSIGVGQYQHDITQSLLASSLAATVEDCVNAVGVMVNSASAALLSHVAGFNQTISQNIVSYRNEHGPFTRRTDLLKVPRLGQKAFEQAAGFVRIMGGQEPLDASAVHPEAYALARVIVADAGGLTGTSIAPQALAALDAQDYVSDTFGLPTVQDILRELEKPGRDPRPRFRTARFTEGVEELVDVEPGMILEGTVSNVAAFGAFVDIGVHQDGLIHVSQMSKSFVANPHEIIKSGDIVRVRVIEVDAQRKRISLSLLLEESSQQKSSPQGRRKPRYKSPA